MDDPIMQDAKRLVAQLTNDIRDINALLARNAIPEFDPNNLELAEINLCLAETTIDQPHYATHYAHAGLRALQGR